jgi:hypothetical protein
MAEEDRITLIIEGLPEDDGQVRFAAFVGQLQSLSATINKLDRDINQGKQANYFSIAELSYGSPARVILEPRAIGRQPYTGHLIIESLDRIREALVNGGDLSDIDADLLEDFRNLARPVGRNVKSAALLFRGNEIQLSGAITTRVDRALAVEEE